MGKYDPLRDYLAAQPAAVTELTLSFREINHILGEPLPRSAYQHRAWWANAFSGGQHPHAQAWLAVGWQTTTVNFDHQQVTFERIRHLQQPGSARTVVATAPSAQPPVPVASLRPGQPPVVDCEGNIKAYLAGDGATAGRDPTGRYASFDYCFNYFQSFRTYPAELASPGNLQMSCLQLGFYLASWGMLRGSGRLIDHSVKVLAPVVGAIAQADADLWAVDANCYTPANLRLVFGFKQALGDALGGRVTLSDTLVTKIMLGVFGCVPAFDMNFCNGFGVSTFNERALGLVAQYYTANQAIIDHYRIQTLDFVTGQPGRQRYTRAKVIDMVFFIAGGTSS